MSITNPHVHTEQEILNSSFDESLGVSMVEVIGADGVLKNPATETKQDTLQELSARIATLTSMKYANEAIRTIPINAAGAASTITTVTGVGSLTNFGTDVPAKKVAQDINNATAILSNINNVIT